MIKGGGGVGGGSIEHNGPQGKLGPGSETLCGHRVPLSRMSPHSAAGGKGLGPKAAISFGNHGHPLREKHCALGALGQALCAPGAHMGQLTPGSIQKLSLTPRYPQCTEAGSCARVRRQGRRREGEGEGRFLSPPAP